jgi:hypothetical protein
MVKKIKVVEIENIEMPETVETPETPETVETSSSKMKLLSPTDETPELIADEPPIQEELKTDEVEPPKEVKTKKQDEKITCSICNKTMLMKTYKYTHQKLCKPVESTKVVEPTKVVEEKPKAKPTKAVEEKPKPKPKEAALTNLGEVSFKAFKEEPNPLDIYRAAKEQRQQVRIQRVKSLISQAI